MRGNPKNRKLPAGINANPDLTKPCGPNNTKMIIMLPASVTVVNNPMSIVKVMDFVFI
jgi:hypothetical protein